MSLAKVIEVLSEGKTIEGAIESAVKQASDSVRQVKHIYVDGIQAVVENTEVIKYRVNLKITFILEQE